MNHLDKLWMKPHGLYVWTHKSSKHLKVSEPKMLCDEIMKPQRGYVRVWHTKGPSALTYDELNIHVKWWVIMKSKCAKANECGDNMIRGNVKYERNLKWV